LIYVSDILAELDIPPSGIQEVQDAVQYPQTTMAPGAATNGESEPSEVMVYYAAQLHMRKLLNDIQKELYQESTYNRSNILYTSIFPKADYTKGTQLFRELPVLSAFATLSTT
jgi:hypothetical protein